MKERRPTGLRRSWLFVGGAEEAHLIGAASSGADVIIQDLEDFTAPAQRSRGREISANVMGAWKAASVVAAVRVNPLDGEGSEDLPPSSAEPPT